MSALEAHVAALIADPLADARSAARNGQRVIGYVSGDVPVELILAAGALPVRLSGWPGRPTAQADRFVERAFMPEIRSIADQWVSGALDFMHTVILPRADDSAQRLYYYICELQRQGHARGPRAAIYDVAGVERESSRLHTVTATANLAREIGTDSPRLPDATREVEERRSLLQQMTALRLTDAPPGGSLMHRIARASQWAWTTQFNAELRQWRHAPTPGTPARRVLLAGNAPPDERIHAAVESSGATIVRELTEAQEVPASSANGTPDASIEALASRYHSRMNLAQRLAKWPDLLINEVRTATAQGVIIWMIEEDETLVWELPALLRTLERAGVPTLALTRQPWAPGAEALRAVSAFAGRLKGAA